MISNVVKRVISLISRRVRYIARIVVLVCGVVPAAGAIAQNTTGAPALGYGPLEYSLPPPGSYQLPSLGPAPDGEILTSAGESIRLHDLFDDRITLLSFIYSNCSDINGCPLSSYVFNKIKSAMQDDAQIARQLQLVSMSFDPERDTPEMMRLYGENFRYAGNAGEWAFVTTESESKLKPILAAYGQDIQRDVIIRPDGGTDYSHLLRVYLIDKYRQIKNIYSVAFLHPDVLLNDVRTLLAESTEPAEAKFETVADVRLAKTISRAGDDKSGYETSDYQTNSLAIGNRLGKPADLIKFTQKPPLGLPDVPVPATNPVTREKIALGRKLFYDRRLSINDTFSCAMCHIPEQGFTSHEIATAVGVEGRTVRRNSQTIYNVAYATRLFHDGREENLEQQVWSPLLAKNEMANPSIGYVLQKIRSFSDYNGLFEAAFDGAPVGMETLGMAIASYERTLVSGNSPFDKWYFAGNNESMSETAQRGFRLFTGKAGCVACHTIGKDSAIFTDNAMHNTGLGYENSIGSGVKSKRVTLAPGVFVDISSEVIESVGNPPPADVGQYEVTENPADRWKYKTPGLRNVALTAPYMHNGQFSTLREVVEFYNQGGVPNPLLDPVVRPLGLNDQDMDDLVAFMMSLTGDNVDELVADGFAAPIGDPGQSHQ